MFLGIHKRIRGGLECDKFKCLSLGIFVLKSYMMHHFLFLSIRAIFCILLYVLFFISFVWKFFSVGCCFLQKLRFNIY